MILYGGIFGCLSPILTISAFLSYKSPFVYPKDEVYNSAISFLFNCLEVTISNILYTLQRGNVERAKLALLADQSGDGTDTIIRQSDHLLMMVAYKKWDKILSAVSISMLNCYNCSIFILVLFYQFLSHIS